MRAQRESFYRLYFHNAVNVLISLEALGAPSPNSAPECLPCPTSREYLKGICSTCIELLHCFGISALLVVSFNWTHVYIYDHLLPYVACWVIGNKLIVLPDVVLPSMSWWHSRGNQYGKVELLKTSFYRIQPKTNPDFPQIPHGPMQQNRASKGTIQDLRHVHKTHLRWHVSIPETSKRNHG